jgi:LysM repeat protein
VSSRPLLVPTNFSKDGQLIDSNIENQINLAHLNVNVENEPKVNKTIRYKVKQGDTISGLAQKFNVQTSHLLSFNGIRASQLKAGQIIKIVTDQTQFGTGAKNNTGKRYKSTNSRKKYSVKSSRYVKSKSKKSANTANRKNRISTKIH